MGRRSQLLDLLDEVSLLVVELLVLAAVCVELAEKLYQLLFVAQEDVQDGLGLVRVCYKHLHPGSEGTLKSVHTSGHQEP